MTGGPRYEELASRIAAHLAGSGKVGEGEQSSEQNPAGRVAIAWSAYLAALIEWDLLSVDDHQRLQSLLPPIENDPATAILLGHG